ncbi:MAG: hypothetical protein AAF901_12845, partial [Bacteroidota bacterium]
MKNEITIEEFERIERYIMNTMEASEHNAFTQELETNPVLKQKHDEVKVMMDGLEAQALKEQLDAFHSELESHSSISDTKVIPLKRYLVAASVVILLGFGGYWILN